MSPTAALQRTGLSSELMHQPEFYLRVLRGIATANWAGLMVLVWVLTWMALSPAMSWGQLGAFRAVFVFIVVEFALGTLLLEYLTRTRAWYQSIPRLGLNRLQQLTTVVLVWDGVHVLGAFEALGGFHGPLVALLPLLGLTPFVMLPRRRAWVASGLLLCAVGLMGAGQLLGWLPPLGAIGGDFLRVPDSTPMVIVVLLSCLFAGSVVGANLGRSFAPCRMPPEQRLAQSLGGFSVATLRRRTLEEEGRLGTTLSTACVLLLDVQGLQEHMAVEGMDAGWTRLRQLSEAIGRQTRSDLDTFAYLGEGRFGLLLPTSDTQSATEVAQRIQQDVCDSQPGIRLRFAVVGLQPAGLGEVRALEAYLQEGLGRMEAVPTAPAS